MSTNCKQGDLAVYVRSVAGNEGKVVRCLWFVPRKVFKNPDGSTTAGPAWRIEGCAIAWTGAPTLFALDAWLRPIRNPGDDAVDEMVAKLGPAPMTLTELREWSNP